MSWQFYEVKEQIKIDKLYTLFKMHFEKGYHFLGEMHDFWECMYVLDGSMCISADDRVHNLSKGEIIVLKPFELHKFNVEDPSGVTLLIFSFSLCGAICSNLQSAYHLDKRTRSIIRDFLEYIELEMEKRTENNKDEYYWNILPQFQTDDIFLQTITLFICRIILSFSSGTSTLAKYKTYETELFKRALIIMNENIAEQLSVNELADRLNISVSSLKRLFDKYAGMSVHKYFLTLKIKTATLFLKSGMSVNEVSESLGFSSQGYFSATYKRETGNNPSRI
ncbi:MAG: helix-turn-helix transcriptional regulator [Clostridia bacterium]|nr:helix-turn-helix transcriptional regulator [Clostridia bacterium]